MADMIDNTAGKDAFAYVGEKGWHGKGQKLTEGAPIEQWTVEAGMAWEAIATDVNYTGTDKKVRRMPGRKLLMRSDTQAALSVVGEDFHVVQPKDVLEFFRNLVGSAGFTLETAGCLYEGRKFFALAKVGKSAKIMGEDEIAPYLLLATACDGSMATAAHLTSVRVVCDNTLRMAIGNGGQLAKIRVPHNAKFRPEIVKAQLGIVTDAWSSFMADIQKLAKFKVSRNEAIDFVAEQLKDEWVDEHGADLNHEQMLESSLALRRIIRLFDGEGKGAQFKSSKGTAWGLLNAVTEYCDWEAGGKTDRNRAFERAHLTDRAAFKVQVANELVKLV